MTSLKPSDFPEVPPPNTITLKVRHQHVNWRGEVPTQPPAGRNVAFERPRGEQSLWVVGAWRVPSQLWRAVHLPMGPGH